MKCNRCGTDADPVIKSETIHKTAFCSNCGAYIQHIRQQPDDDFTWFHGKYTGRNVKSMLADPRERSYLVWAYDNMKTLKESQKRILERWLHL